MLTPRERIGHLFRRAGFGAPPSELKRWEAEGIEAAVDHLLGVPREPEPIDPPALKQGYDPDKFIDIQANWLHRMVTTRYPLVEKMTLFWHGHFATGAHKVKSPLLMQRQNDLQRRHALGSFPALLRETAKDGAMLIWLDGHRSHRRSPNENYAREVMELFTTGPGAYTEQDVQEAARAFTGYVVMKETGEVTCNPFAFDPREKGFLGQTGKFGSDEISDILAGRPETAQFLAAKLWRFFASPTPDASTVKAMADAYLASRGEMGPVLRTLFLSEAFYDEALVGAHVRSPADFVAATMRLLSIPASREAAYLCIKMGQSLFDPPNVAGWPGGPAWLGSSTMLVRWNLGEGVRTWLGQKPRTDLVPEADSPEELLRAWLDFFGIIRVSETTGFALRGLVGDSLPKQPRQRWELTKTLIRTIIAAPEYQVA